MEETQNISQIKTSKPRYSIQQQVSGDDEVMEQTQNVSQIKTSRRVSALQQAPTSAPLPTLIPSISTPASSSVDQSSTSASESVVASSSSTQNEQQSTEVQPKELIIEEAPVNEFQRLKRRVSVLKSPIKKRNSIIPFPSTENDVQEPDTKRIKLSHDAQHQDPTNDLKADAKANVEEAKTQTQLCEASSTLASTAVSNTEQKPLEVIQIDQTKTNAQKIEEMSFDDPVNTENISAIVSMAREPTTRIDRETTSTIKIAALTQPAPSPTFPLISRSATLRVDPFQAVLASPSRIKSNAGRDIRQSPLVQPTPSPRQQLQSRLEKKKEEDQAKTFVSDFLFTCNVRFFDEIMISSKTSRNSFLMPPIPPPAASNRARSQLLSTVQALFLYQPQISALEEASESLKEMTSKVQSHITALENDLNSNIPPLFSEVQSLPKNELLRVQSIFKSIKHQSLLKAEMAWIDYKLRVYTKILGSLQTNLVLLKKDYSLITSQTEDMFRLQQKLVQDKQRTKQHNPSPNTKKTEIVKAAKQRLQISTEEVKILLGLHKWKLVSVSTSKLSKQMSTIVLSLAEIIELHVVVSLPSPQPQLIFHSCSLTIKAPISTATPTSSTTSSATLSSGLMSEMIQQSPIPKLFQSVSSLSELSQAVSLAELLLIRLEKLNQEISWLQRRFIVRCDWVHQDETRRLRLSFDISSITTQSKIMMSLSFSPYSYPFGPITSTSFSYFGRVKADDVERIVSSSSSSSSPYRRLSNLAVSLSNLVLL